jgi:predicted ATPase
VPEQVILRRLGIFAGDFVLEAAEGVCAGVSRDQNGQEPLMPEAIFNHPLQLVNKSLVQFNQDTGRYHLLEMIRFFCLERLAEVGETQAVSAQQLAWYLQLAEEAAPRLSGPQQATWGARHRCQAASQDAQLLLLLIRPPYFDRCAATRHLLHSLRVIIIRLEYSLP